MRNMLKLTFESPKVGASSAKASLHFVGNAEAAVTTNRLKSTREEILGELY